MSTAPMAKPMLILNMDDHYKINAHPVQERIVRKSPVCPHYNSWEGGDDQVDVQVNKTTAIPGGVYDRRPSQVEGLVKSDISAFYFENCSNITIRSSSASWGKALPTYYARALFSKGVINLKLDGFDGVSASQGEIKAISKNP